jgi:DNA-binding winged helix-turn-helix (wHTH) protein/tetratricopeptide (TPR) repeat protein
LEKPWDFVGLGSATSTAVDGSSYSFGPFRLHPNEHLLLRGDTPIPLAPKTYELLTMLVTRHGRLLTRDELMKAIWPDSFVEEINLTVNISLLRKLLGEQPDGKVYIITVPKRGYRFDAPVVESLPPCAPPPESIVPVSIASGDIPEPAPPSPRLNETPPPEAVTTLAAIPELHPRLWHKWAILSLAVIVLAACAWLLYRSHASHPAAHESVSPVAYEAYAKGRAQLNKRSMESVQQSLELFQQAIEADPRYAAAYSGLADAYLLAGSYGNSFLAPQVAMPKAKLAAQKALALDDASAESHTSLAYIKLVYDWDWSGAENEFRRALTLDPSYVSAHHWYSHELMAEGRIAESHQQSEMALALAPADVLMNEHMAWHHLMAREYDRAIPQALKTIELNPDFIQAHRVLGLGYLYTNRLADACAEFQKGTELSHNDPVARAYLARCYARAHRTADARSILDALISASSERYISAAEIAGVYAALGDANKSLEWLDKACSEHAGALVYLNIDPVYDRMRGDPRFQAIVRRVNLTPIVDESLEK